MTKILIVDDSPIDRRLAGRLLVKESDWTVEDAVDGRDALVKIERAAPDMIVTDLTMPEMDGLTLVEEVKNRFPTIPVVLMTSMGSEEVAIKALRAGAAGYVPKRRLAEDLHTTVSRLLVTLRQSRTRFELLQRMSRFECAFSLENETDMVLSLPSYTQELLKSMRLMDDNEYLRMSVAVEEALLNALYHGNLEVASELLDKDHTAFHDLVKLRATLPPYRDRRIHFSVKVTPQEAVFTVRDQGPGFDPSALPDPVAPGYLERAHGRGILLMRSFMDEVHFNARGNEVTLTKKRSLGTLDDLPLLIS